MRQGGRLKQAGRDEGCSYKTRRRRRRLKCEKDFYTQIKCNYDKGNCNNKTNGGGERKKEAEEGGCVGKLNGE